MTDIVEQLRALQNYLADQAAEEIERLRNAPAIELVAVVAATRSDALEEAAQFCAEGNERADGNYFAAAIRALKEKTP